MINQITALPALQSSPRDSLISASALSLRGFATTPKSTSLQTISDVSFTFSSPPRGFLMLKTDKHIITHRYIIESGSSLPGHIRRPNPRLGQKDPSQGPYQQSRENARARTLVGYCMNWYHSEVPYKGSISAFSTSFSQPKIQLYQIFGIMVDLLGMK